MRSRHNIRLSARFLLALVVLILALFAMSLVMAQEDSGAAAVQQNPVRQAMGVARELIEDDIGYRMRLRRWRFFEDTWNSEASGRLYGSWGIDNCVASIPILEKRGNVIYGWTFIFTETSGDEHQARVSYDLQDSVICDNVRIPPQYAPPPEPTAAPQAADADAQAAGPAAPAAASAANVSGFNLGGHVDGLDGNAINYMRRAGMTWVKKQVRHGISDGGGIIGTAHANGFKVLLGALGDKNQLANNFDNYVREFAKYVGFLAGQGADAIEVWNEPNIDREWPTGQVNGGSYTRLLAAAYNAIKAANPATIVISGAPAPTGFYGAAGCAAAGCNDDHFMRQMAQAGAASYMDCVGIHYNAGTSPPNSTTGANVGGWHYSWYLPSMMNVYRGAFPTKPLCFTELGYLSGEGYGPLPGGFAWASNTSLAEHAAWLGGAVSVARSSGYVNMIIVWNVNFTLYGADPMAGYAIIRPGGGCPACDSLRGALGG